MTERKPPAKKAVAKRAPAKKAATKTAAKKTTPAKKAPAKKTSVRGKTGARSSGMGAARPSKPRGGLHLVPPDGAADDLTAEKSKVPKIATAAAASDTRQILEALRARIAGALDAPNTPPRDLAALSRRLLEIQREIKALDADDDDDAIGEAARTPDEEFDASGI